MAPRAIVSAARTAAALSAEDRAAEAHVEHERHPWIVNMRELIRDVPDFPRPGVLFKDITPLLAHPAALSLAVEYMSQPFRHTRVDRVVAAESRGFIFGAAVAQSLSAGFVPIRKLGRLPSETHAETYTLEYGNDTVEIHRDAIREGDQVVLVDDVLATGGTLSACCRLVEKLGGRIVGLSVLLELGFLNGRALLKNYPTYSVLRFDS